MRENKNFGIGNEAGDTGIHTRYPRFKIFGPSLQFLDNKMAFIAMRNLVDMIRVVQQGVITSYSIHYTKLYDPSSLKHSACIVDGLYSLPAFAAMVAAAGTNNDC